MNGIIEDNSREGVPYGGKDLSYNASATTHNYPTDDNEVVLLDKNNQEYAQICYFLAVSCNINGKRKIAAKELGISERTLYRKIKQFDLQDDENE